MNANNKMCKNIPKTVWILWFQGFESAPYVVKKCIDSWIVKNPTWSIILLSEDTISEYITIGLEEKYYNALSLNHKSDIIRLHLLEKYGGIWVDSTVFCRIPLDNWLKDYVGSGYFSFYKPGADRLISSWFIAADIENPLISNLKNEMIRFWNHKTYYVKKPFAKKMGGYCSLLFNRHVKTTRFWFSPIVTNIFKIYPYFILHYQFARVLRKNNLCKNIWDNTPKISADDAHRIQKVGLFVAVNKEIIKTLKIENAPVYKLNYKKFIDSEYKSHTLIYHLLENKLSLD